MITVKEAAQSALDYLTDIYSSMELKDPMIEEVELSDDDKFWRITIGFLRPVESTNLFGQPSSKLLQKKYQKEYKLFEISIASGKVKAMKIRTV
jgi:hypothetical protein